MLGDRRVFRSRLPAMFSEVLKQVGIKGFCVPFMVEPKQIGQALQSLRYLNMDGASIAVPFKEMVIPYLDVLSEGATIIGAVNTVVHNGDVLKGYNTNAIGFMDALGEVGFDVAGKAALVFGTGGAAKAVVFILNWLRAGPIFVTGRNVEKARQIVGRIGGEAISLESLLDRPTPVDIVVNATSVSSPDESSEMAGLVQKLNAPGCELIVDFNYGRSKNFWQDLARARNIRFMDGLPTLAYQARRTLALWTRAQVQPQEFIKALERISEHELNINFLAVEVP